MCVSVYITEAILLDKEWNSGLVDCNAKSGYKGSIHYMSARGSWGSSPPLPPSNLPPPARQPSLALQLANNSTLML